MNNIVLDQFITEVNNINQITQEIFKISEQLGITKVYNNKKSHESFVILFNTEVEAVKKVQIKLQKTFNKYNRSLSQYERAFVTYCLEQIEWFVKSLIQEEQNVATWLELNKSVNIKLTKAMNDLEKAENIITSYTGE